MNGHLTTAFAVVALCAAGRVDAATKTWSGAVNNYDWTESGNYNGGLPAAGDVVELPDGASVLLSDAASFNFVNTLDRIVPASNATLTVTLAAGVTNTLAVPFTAYPAITNSCHGRLVKTGGGTLFLNSMKLDNGLTGDKQRSLDYYCRLDINEGDVAMNQTAGSKNGQLGVVTIAGGAKLFSYGDPTTTPNYEVCATYFAEMWGSGSIRAMRTPPVNKFFFLHPDDKYTLSDSVFAGDIGENISLYAGGRWQLTGNSSTSYAGIQVARNFNKDAAGARLAVATFGTKDGTSSIGKGRGTINYRGGGGYVLYTGTGETTDLIIQGQTGSSNPYPSFFDAGAHGGLEIKGDISVSKYQGGMERLVLTGSNTVPCSITGQLLAGDQQQSSGGATGGFFFIKRGIGTWRFADYVSGNTLNDGKRDNRTTITIEEGTLQFDSLVETNKYCSLGVGTRLQEPYSGAFDASHNVDYFFRLGRTSVDCTIPVLELSGLGSADWGVSVGTRKVALAGSGRISNASDNRFRLAGVSALAGGDEAVKYLYLGGTRNGGDEILDLTDGAGKLGVVKDGSGTWTLGGDVNFTGLLDVREGTLVIKRYSSRNTWFRFTATEMLQNSDYFYDTWAAACPSDAEKAKKGKGIAFSGFELGVFDAQGNPISKGITNCLKACNVDAGGAGYDRQVVGGLDSLVYNGGYTDRSLDKMFDGDINTGWQTYWQTDWNDKAYLVQSNEKSWTPIVFRLPDGAAEAASWDLGRWSGLQTAASYREITAGIFETSPDGIHWTTVTNATVIPLKNSDDRKYWASDFSTDVKSHTGWPVQGDSGRTWTVMPNTPVKVAPGATLRADISATGAAGKPVLNNVTVATTGGGTIDGFAFAESGTLNVEGLPEGSGIVFIPVEFANASDLNNVSKWTLLADGVEKTNKRLSVRSTGISVVPIGFYIVVR